MIQNHRTIKLFVADYNKALNEQRILGQVQKIYSCPHYICLSLRLPGKSKYLYLGRGARKEGLFWGESLPPSSIRIRDRFLEYLRIALAQES